MYPYLLCFPRTPRRHYIVTIKYTVVDVLKRNSLTLLPRPHYTSHGRFNNTVGWPRVKYFGQPVHPGAHLSYVPAPRCPHCLAVRRSRRQRCSTTRSRSSTMSSASAARDDRVRGARCPPDAIDHPGWQRLRRDRLAALSRQTGSHRPHAEAVRSISSAVRTLRVHRSPRVLPVRPPRRSACVLLLVRKRSRRRPTVPHTEHVLALLQLIG